MKFYNYNYNKKKVLWVRGLYERAVWIRKVRRQEALPLSLADQEIFDFATFPKRIKNSNLLLT
jgi:hypothetical protein